MGLLDTVTESLFGDAYAEGRWRPLSLSTFFSEGWLEPWASAPAGQDGLTPRHGWRGAFDGVFYRLWIATFGYSNSINAPYGGNRYFGNYTIFLPFSRRFEIVMNVPFVVANGTKDPMRGYTSEFGDLAVGPASCSRKPRPRRRCSRLGSALRLERRRRETGSYRWRPLTSSGPIPVDPGWSGGPPASPYP